MKGDPTAQHPQWVPFLLPTLRLLPLWLLWDFEGAVLGDHKCCRCVFTCCKVLERDSLLSKNSEDIITQKSEQVLLQLSCLPSACTAEGEVAGGEPYMGPLEKQRDISGVMTHISSMQKCSVLADGVNQSVNESPCRTRH